MVYEVSFHGGGHASLTEACRSVWRLFIDIAGSKFWGRGTHCLHYQHHRNNARIVGVGCGALSIMQ